MWPRSYRPPTASSRELRSDQLHVLLDSTPVGTRRRSNAADEGRRIGVHVLSTEPTERRRSFLVTGERISD
ncbi:hypothetical protein BRC68_10925 [Halobacteriales archaeon QH_6_64_20]|nr:MAG: hypothetical protein BRC68_10925 [Halobacteriales archaeon QH_6_64_20]